MPTWSQIQRDVKAGRAEVKTHSKHSFVLYRDKNGGIKEVYNQTLHGDKSKKETTVGGLKAKIVDKKILQVRNPLTGKRYGGIKVGTQVVIQKDKLGQRALNKVSGGKLNPLSRLEGYRKAGRVEAGAVRAKISIGNSFGKHKAKSELKKIVEAAEKISKVKGSGKALDKALDKEIEKAMGLGR
jgi:hypothetical protein